MPTNALVDKEQIMTEAAEWLSCLHQSQVNPAMHQDFVLWLLRSSDHLELFLKATRVYGEVEHVRGMPNPQELVKQVRETPQASNVLAFRPATVREELPVPQARVKPRRVGLRIAMAAVLLLSTVSAGWYGVDRWGYPSHIRTHVGEQRSLSLDDGSMVQLNTDTSLTVQLSRSERRIGLARGEARFSVAKDRNRPFIVTTPHAVIRALGTAFNVRIIGVRTVVSVLEGHVDVTGRGESASGVQQQPLVLGINQQAQVTQGQVLSGGGPPFERAARWKDRRLVSREEKLADVVAELNRYHQVPLRIADANLSGLQISGEFDVIDRTTLLEYLRRYEGVIIKQEGSELVLRRGPSQSKKGR